MFDLMATGGRIGLFCVGVQLAKATFLILSKQLAPALLILRKVSSFLSLLMKVPSVFYIIFLNYKS
jgi:hypothetical protein